MDNEQKERLKKAIKSGYNACLDSCFDNISIYTQGFIDGIAYQKDNIIPKSKLQILLEQIEENGNQD